LREFNFHAKAQRRKGRKRDFETHNNYRRLIREQRLDPLDGTTEHGALAPLHDGTLHEFGMFD